MQNNIQVLRRARGWTQAHLAKMVGTSQQQIQRYEKGLISISLTKAEEIASALGARLSEVFPEDPLAQEPRRVDVIEMLMDRFGMNRAAVLTIATVTALGAFETDLTDEEVRAEIDAYYTRYSK